MQRPFSLQAFGGWIELQAQVAAGEGVAPASASQRRSQAASSRWISANGR
ncbi:hypothetical protein PUV44_08135 [Xanthomonas arboricola pv. corylina]|nr:hypothetical protein PUV44_08135 [Xanthomonas arboricola pv. corylina]